MSKLHKTLNRILSGSADANIDFKDLIHLLGKLGFDFRIRGSHHICTRNGVEEIINLQPKGNRAKAYQVKQVRDMILKYKLAKDEQ